MPGERFTLWAHHPAVRRWVPLVRGLVGQAAVDEMVTRQDRVRRGGYPTRFALRPDGEDPPPVPK